MAISRVSYAIARQDETPIYYRLTEPDQITGVPVVLTDGIGCDGYVWKYLRAELEPSRRLLHWHYRGHGRTPKPRDPKHIAIADHAQDLVCVLDDTETDSAVLCSHSMGVQVALECYRQFPDRVRGLILLCGAPSHPLRTFRGQAGAERVLPAVRRAVEWAPNLLAKASRTLLPTKLAYSVAARVEINHELLAMADFMPYLRGLSRVEPSYFLAMLAAASQHSANEVLPTIAVPTLIVAGARDGFTPPELSHQMAETIPDCELLVVEDGSHTAPLERPDEVCGRVSDFLNRRFDRVGPQASASELDRRE